MNTNQAPSAQGKTVADLTDDEIVDAIASFGVHGVYVAFGGFAKRAGFIWDGAASERVDELCFADRLMWLRDDVLSLDLSEWGKRLANRSADEIARMLKGAP